MQQMRAAPAGPSEIRPSIHNSEGRLPHDQVRAAPAQGRGEESRVGRERWGSRAFITPKKIPSFAFDEGPRQRLEVSFVQQRQLLRARPLQQVPRDHPLRRLRGDPRVLMQCRE